MFDFNDSLNVVTPVSPMLLSVDMKRKEKKKRFSSEFLLHQIKQNYLHLRMSALSVVVAFIASFNALTSVLSIFSPLYMSVKRK